MLLWMLVSMANYMKRFVFISIFGLVLGYNGHLAPALAQDSKHLALDSPFDSFVEDDFPFFSQTLDARNLVGDWPKDNLSPRAVIMQLGGGYYAAFDIDLLRVALVWKANEKGEYLTMNGMAAGSYRLPNQKAAAGQTILPTPIGNIVNSGTLNPGWIKEGGDWSDKRERKGADKEEPGLGPGAGLRWLGMSPTKHGVVLKYEVFGVPIEEKWEGGKRVIEVSPHDSTLSVKLSAGGIHTFPPSKEVSGYAVSMVDGGEFPRPTFPVLDCRSIETKLVKSEAQNGFRIEEVGLPIPNPFKRNVRLSAFGFLRNGDAVVATFDGDVWKVSGLSGDLSLISWRRIGSGLHEPLGLEVVDDEIYVFTRNGIVRLHDRDGDRVIDWYENFSSVVPQTAETREFANDIFAKPGGGFYLAKGGQVSSTKGVANGTVVEVSQDGQSYKIISTGLRMPYIGVDPKSGLIAASDQQGNWKPTTPIHIIRPGEDYGFQPEKYKDKAVHTLPIVEPEIWIPHFVNQSGASLIWLRDGKMGVLNDSLIHIGYNRPEIFKVFFDRDGEKVIQGAVASVAHKFASGLLKGKVHPVDGSLWLTGFKIWGTSAEQISGLYRVTPTLGPVWVPADLRSEKRGVLLSFHQPVDVPIAGNWESYSVDRWNYVRSHNYGSGHYKLNGDPGQDSLPVASVKISKDGKSVFLGIPDMKPCHSLRVTYKVPTSTEARVANAFFTVHQLRSIDLKAVGFEDDNVLLELSAEMLTQAEKIEPSADLGKETATKFGCMVCHAAGENVPLATASFGTQVAVGPAWNGLWNSKRNFSDGTELKNVDEVYLRESILDPARKVAVGFEMEKTGVGMPSYLGVLKNYEIDSLVMFIKTLQKVKPKKK